MTQKRIKDDTKDNPPSTAFAQNGVLDHIANKPAITVDYEKYAHLLDDPDLSEDQKREFLQAVWNIIVGFVDLGFGVHPVQQAQDSCGESRKSHAENTITVGNALKSKDTKITSQFADITNTTKGGAPDDTGFNR